MCDTCGCGEHEENITIKFPGETSEENDGILHSHHHPHSHHHVHTHSHDQNHALDNNSERTIKLGTDILHRNNLMAERNRGYFDAKNILPLNIVSSPGSGKTSLLERSLKELKDELSIYVIEGDQQSMNDANRIDSIGIPVIQVNTGNGCHLDAVMINKAINKLQMVENSILMIENVGNLVCPAMFDLGEKFRVVIMSVTEGDDKPAKYPTMFHTSNLCIINKIDLLPYVDFDIAKAKKYARQMNPELEFIELSVKNGEGMKKWHDWIYEKIIKP